MSWLSSGAITALNLEGLSGSWEPSKAPNRVSNGVGWASEEAGRVSEVTGML